MQREWSAEELIGSWTLVDEDWRLVGNKSGATRLGFALLLKFFEIEARFPRDADELPSAAVAYVAEQVKVDPAEFADTSGQGERSSGTESQIRTAFGFREFSRGDEAELAAWLAEEVCPVELRDEQLREALLVRCRASGSSRRAGSSGSSARPGRRSSSGSVTRTTGRLERAVRASGWRRWSARKPTGTCWPS